MAWLAPDFAPPARLDLETGEHLRPIRADDVEIDYPAVMGSQPRLWGRYGEVWGWPPATMTYEADREDLARHEREAAALESFNYAILDAGETRLLGCLYIDPPNGRTRKGADALVSWWVIDDAVGSPLERCLAEAIPQWLADSWGFERVDYL
jgi:hypothetical protein